MLKRTSIFVLFLFALFAFLPQTTLAVSPVTGHKIVIDPGHGGTDLGSTACPTLTEADANLQIANKLKTLLETDRAIVGMTRTDDSYKSNNDRYTFANNFGGEALVSVHLNGSIDHSKNGTLGLYGKLNKDKAFAERIHARLATELGVSDLGVTNFASGVLLKVNMPATIQETVFISNTTECTLLSNSTGTRQQEIAQSLYNGLIDWFAQPTPTPKPGKNK
ncbi:N-acetylmuramoyl-L-alanine amidase [Candidatus Microgenomates bacterium]|nr:N-acetylmuramoyl-L-alanine amidase [Candidatus Microgenomates bacterium]